MSEQDKAGDLVRFSIAGAARLSNREPHEMVETNSKVFEGGVTRLPEIKEITPENANLASRSSIMAFFQMSYALGQGDADLVLAAEFLFGDNKEDGKELIGWMEENPYEVADTYELVSGELEDTIYLAETYRHRASTGNLRKYHTAA